MYDTVDEDIGSEELRESTSALLPLMPGSNYAATVLAAGFTPDVAKLIQPEASNPTWITSSLPLPGRRIHGMAVTLADGSIALVGGIEAGRAPDSYWRRIGSPMGSDSVSTSVRDGEREISTSSVSG